MEKMNFGYFGRTCSVLVFLFSAAMTFSQIAGGLNETTRTDYGGEHFIAGTVFSPAGRPVQTRIRIRLSTPNGEVITTTDDTGKFVFSGLKNGQYTVSVDGDKQYQPVAEYVDIAVARGTLPQSFVLTIRLVENVERTTKKPEVIRPSGTGVPKDAAAHYTKAIELSKAANQKAAIDELKLAITVFPTYLLALNELGVQYMKLNDLDAAAEYFESALKVQPDAYEPIVNKGILLVRQKRFTEAETPLKKALELKDGDATVHYYLGRTLLGLTRFDEAEAQFNLALTTGGSEMKEAHRMLGSLYIEKGDNPRAAAALEAYLKANPNAADAEKLRGVIRQLQEGPQNRP